MISIKKTYNILLNKIKYIYSTYEINKIYIILLTYILKCNINKLYFYILNSKRLDNKEYFIFLFLLNRIKNRYPIQYIIGYTYFNGIKILLNNNIFIPRQETEEMVNIIYKENKNKKKLKILDIGTGSGCISIFLRKKNKNISNYCLDYTNNILSISKKNFFLNKIKKKIKFLKFNLLNSSNKYKILFKSLPKFDIIISNPPYISYYNYYKYINSNIFYEPYKSIFVQNDDILYYYKKIINNFLNYKLKKKGIIYFEISNYIKHKIDLYFKKKYKNLIIKFIKDFNNNYRILKIIKK
ncbi:MAG: HemK family protein methyltransferase [Candidatus Shikimatogenerans bostrichidophilus]|nr:MAG: HemK family protein methyltransferase [Candidatus Shikimatogenerans bostrichidophilus]